MSDVRENEPVHCPVCRDMVGVYERAVFANPDGRHMLGSLLTVPMELASDYRVVHAACWDGAEPLSVG